jgi:hypothetical protein
VAQAFFEGDDEMSLMRPKLHPVTLGDAIHFTSTALVGADIIYRRGALLCASCPLVSQEECLATNLDWMREQLSKSVM